MSIFGTKKNLPDITQEVAVGEGTSLTTSRLDSFINSGQGSSNLEDSFVSTIELYLRTSDANTATITLSLYDFKKEPQLCVYPIY